MNDKIQFDFKEQAIITEAVKLSDESFTANIKSHVKNFQWWIAAIVLICVFGFIQLLISYFQFTSATYKEYSKKSESIETVQNINQELLKEVKENQEIIVELQKQILNKK